MIGSDCDRAPGVLVIRREGRVERTGSPWEPFRLVDPDGGVVRAAGEYLRDLQAAGRAEATQRSYAHDLLRWFRFLWAVGVPWDQATRAEARDFCRWVQIAAKPVVTHWRHAGEGLAAAASPAAVVSVPNPVTGKAAPGPGYAPARRERGCG